jgi:hypothetical protein
MILKICFKKTFAVLLTGCSVFAATGRAEAQTAESPHFVNLELKDLSQFEKTAEPWKVAGDISFDLSDARKVNLEKGKGILAYMPDPKQDGALSTVFRHQDILLEFSFMLAKGSTAGVYLLGQYGIELSDAWSEGAQTSTCGAILINSGSARMQPRMNVCRAPGLWQKMQVFFKAPRPGDDKKPSGAVFAKIVLNGVVIHENIILEALQAAATSGPVVFKAGSPVGFKDIRYVSFKSADEMDALLSLAGTGNTRDRQIVIAPSQKTIVQRCFIEYDQKKRTFCAAVGGPEKIHYAMDLSQAAMVNFWKGDFIDATSMWTDRGEYQIAEPLGSKIETTPAPPFAVLSDSRERWPEKQSDHFKFNGYSLDQNGRPTFDYTLDGIHIQDRIVPAEGSRSLNRTLTVVSNQAAKVLWYRLAEGSNIRAVGDNLFTVDDNSYYIKLVSDKKVKPVIRDSAGKKELIVPGGPSAGALTYSIIW